MDLGTIIFFLIIIPFVIGWFSMAPWVPTKKRDVERLLDILEIDNRKRFLEIGTWDGRVAYAVAKRFPDIQVYGIEIAFPMFCIAYMRNIIPRQHNYHVRLANAFREDFWNYDSIYVFWMPDKMQKKIVPKFLKEAKKWAKLYSYVFSIPEWYNQYAKSYGQENEARIHVLEKK